MTVALDAPVSQLDPLRLATSLLEEVDNTVIVCDVNRSFTSQEQVRDLVDLRKLAGGLDLKIAVAMSESLLSNGLAFKF
jgi:2-C-methyl-D-erythritol 4-phosphate cytidylyltransferase